MTSSNVQPSYPGSIFPWTDRIDNVNIDFAADINSAVAEVESIEKTLGAGPQVELNPPTGIPVVYSTVAARISDAMNNNLLPFSSLWNVSATIPNNTGGTLLSYKQRLDPYGMYNGTDLTLTTSGWWELYAAHAWNWESSGYDLMQITVNGSAAGLDSQLFDWTFSGNIKTGTSDPRYWQFGKRNRRTSVAWGGILHKGDRVSVYAENGTPDAAQVINVMELSAIMIRPVSQTFTAYA
jgi:hypothetical protein